MSKGEPVVAGVDLARLDVGPLAEGGVEIELLHPATRAPLGVYITVKGADSSAYRRALVDRVRKRQTEGAGGAGDDRTADQLDEDAAAIMARVTMAWRNVQIDGAPVECNVQSALALYVRFGWIRQQINDFVERRANFLPVGA